MQESGMDKQKIREQSPKKPKDEGAKAATIDANMELGDEELSKVSGGTLTCVKGEHFKKVIIIT